MDENMQLIDLSEDVTYSQMHITESDNPYVLCVMEGIFMGPFNEDNENGRDYLTETIEKKILQNRDVIVGLKTKTQLGEAHHPLDRVSIWSDESCISTTALWLSDDKKYLYGRADVLDVPKGRIVNTLLRYGSQLGISARAKGKPVKRRGRNVILPENYYFKTFDVVLNPGFEKARPQVFEQSGRPLEQEGSNIKGDMMHEEFNQDVLYENFKDMLESKTGDVETIKKYIDYSESDKLKSLLPLCESTESTESDVNDSTEHEQGASQESEEVSKLNEEIEGYKKLVEDKENTIREFKAHIKNLNTDLERFSNVSEELDESLAHVRELEELTEELRLETSKAENEILVLEEKLVESRRSEFRSKSEVEQLTKSLKRTEKVLEDMSEENSKLAEEVVVLNKMTSNMDIEIGEKIQQNDSLSEEVVEISGIVEGLNSQNRELQEMYEEVNLKLDRDSTHVSKPAKPKRREKVEYFSNKTDAEDLNEEKQSVSKSSMTRRSFIAQIGGKNYGQ